MNNIVKVLNMIKCDNYESAAYKIMDDLNRNDLIKIVEIERLNWVNIYSTDEEIKREIYESLVKWRNKSRNF